MRKEREGHSYPAYSLRPSRDLAQKYLASQGAPLELSTVPLTYMIFLRGEAHGVDLFQDLDIPRQKALHGGQRYEWFAPIGWDDDVRVTTTVLKIVEKATKNGPLWIADVQYDYTLADTRQLAVRELTRIIKRELKMADFKTGDIVFRRQVPGSSKQAIAMFSIATEDPNPIHTDEQFAKDCGFPQVIQQGPMTTAHFARLLAETVGANRLKVLDVSFTAPVFPEEPLTLTATVGKIEDRVTVELRAEKNDGTVTAKGFALLAAT